MKNQEKNVSTKKKILTYYLILAASLLVIAAITVGVIFAVRGNDFQIDNKPGTSDDENKPGNPDDNKPDDKDPDADKPASSTYEFIFPVENADVTNGQAFGYDKTMDWYAVHDGTDFAAAAGTKVVAAVDGTITEIATSDVFYGAYITIEHANGVKTVYKFIEPAENLKRGDKVNRGQTIGTVAAAAGIENADGAHLHFEVYKNGVLADLDEYLDVNEK
ncbi:MAG: M23 family metallopeptidase [Clostridia bacterium]|nr:M23 family metallopeptidase [Clostridia bacterium]